MRAKKSLKQMPHKRVFLLLGLGIASAALGASLALTQHNVGLKNTVRTPTVTTEIEEDLEKGGKKVRFENTGSADVFLRVSFGEAWHYNENGAAADADTKTENTANAITEANAGDAGVDQSTAADTASPEGEILSNMVTITDEGAAKVVPAAQPLWLWDAETPPETSVADLWQDGGDGWWYYKKVLPAKDGDSNSDAGADAGQNADSSSGSPANMTGYILKSVDFSNVEKIADASLRKKYQSASYDLHFVIETVQASDEWRVSLNAIQALFGEQNADGSAKKKVSIKLLDDMGSADAAAYWDKNKYGCKFQWKFNPQP